MTKNKIKHLWKGLFSYRCELKVEYAYAFTKQQAKFIMMKRLAKKQEVIPCVVFNYFKEHENNYEIKIETEFKEVMENETKV